MTKIQVSESEHTLVNGEYKGTALVACNDVGDAQFMLIGEFSPLLAATAIDVMITGIYEIVRAIPETSLILEQMIKDNALGRTDRGTKIDMSSLLNLKIKEDFANE